LIIGQQGTNRIILNHLLDLSSEKTVEIKIPHNRIYEIDIASKEITSDYTFF